MGILTLFCAIILVLSASLGYGAVSSDEVSSGWPVPFHDPSGTNTLDGRGVLRDPRVRWTYELGGVITTRVVTEFGQIVAGTRNGTIVFLDLDTGEELNRVELAGAVQWIGIVDELTAGDLRTVVQSRTEELSSVTLLHGNEVEWDVRGAVMGFPSFVPDFREFSAVVFGYMAEGQKPAKGLGFVDLDSGLLQWLSMVAMPVTPPRLGDLDQDGALEIAFLDTSGRLAVLANDGQTLWIRDLNRGVLQSPIVADFTCEGVQEVLLPLDREPLLSLPANLSLYDPSGTLIWSKTFPSTGIRSTAAVSLRSMSCRDVVVALSDGTLQAFRGDTGGSLWTAGVDSFAILGADLQGDSLGDVLALSEETGPSAINGSTGNVLWDPPFYRPIRSAALARFASGQVWMVLAGEDWIGVLVSGPPQTDPLVLLLILVSIAVSVSIAALAYYRRRK
jgi:outer membrane protein assembly factor BamB